MATRMVETATGVCRAGVARGDITPPVGIYHRMWGAATHERATGVHRPLTATVLLLVPIEGERDQAQVLIALDHCLFWAREMDVFLDAISGQTGWKREQLSACFSHTHGAGLMGLERVHLPGGEMIPGYLAKLHETVSALIRQAEASLERVTITYGRGRCELARQRDLWDAESNQYVCGFNPEADADDTVTVARIFGEKKLLATVVNYACHPTTLAWANTLISPDFVGAMREVIEHDTQVPCIFLQGASGDLGPKEGFVGDTAVADRNGRELGHAALAALTALPPPATRFVYSGPVISGATLGPWEHQWLDEAALREKSRWQVLRLEVPLPYRAELPQRDQTEAELKEWQAKEAAATQAGDVAAARDAHAMIERKNRQLLRIATLPAGSHFPLPVTLLRIGDVFWVFVEGEHYQYLQTSLRQRLPGLPLFVTTLANGSRCAYLCTREAYGKGIYQETIAVLAAGSLETLAEVIEEEIRKLG